MALSRKYYVAVAAILSEIPDAAYASNPDVRYDEGREDARDFIAERLADWFAKDNPNFDRARFMMAATWKVS